MPIQFNMDTEFIITITIDENLMDKVNYKIENKTLDLNQKEWIQPCRRVLITIGTPTLSKTKVIIEKIR